VYSSLVAESFKNKDPRSAFNSQVVTSIMVAIISSIDSSLATRLEMFNSISDLSEASNLFAIVQPVLSLMNNM
jgi:hypothetical protein